MFFAIAIIALFCISIYFLKSRRYKFPPGPRGLPFLGVSHKLDPTGAHKTFTAWSEEYGDVIGIKIYGEKIVILNSYETIYDALVSRGNDFAGRPETFRWKVLYKFCDGIIFTSSSPKWIFLKKTSTQILKMYGDTLLTLEKISLDMISDTLEDLRVAADGAEPLDIGSKLQSCVADIITSIIFGDKVNNAEVFLNSQQAAIERTPKGFALDLLPVLRHFPLQKTYKAVLQVQHNLVSLYEGALKKVRESYVPGSPSCFFHGLLDYQLNENGKGDFNLSDDDMYALGADFIQAGIVTTSVTLKSLMSVLVNCPEIQDQLAEEIFRVLGSRLPRLADRVNMHYCQAVILEVLRYQTMLPLNVIHTAVKDTKMNGFDIPKDTRIFCNFWKLNHDPEFWQAPWKFKPERFLDEDNKVVAVDHPNRKRLLVFGAGRRVCIGQALAMNRLFLIMTCLIQRFHLLPESEEKRPKHDPRDYINGYNIFPEQFNVIIKHREGCV